MNKLAVELQSAIDEALQAPYRRVARFETLKGTPFWMKRIERSAPLLWLVKGTPNMAFDRDRCSHHFLWHSGVPVPAIVTEGTGYFVLEDAGASLTDICKSNSLTAEDKEKACHAAGQALARLHSIDLAHGRPAFRDMCWDGQQIRFIDLEYFVQTRAGRIRKARDVGIALVSALSQSFDGLRYAHVFLSAYRASRRRRSEYFHSPHPQRTK